MSGNITAQEWLDSAEKLGVARGKFGFESFLKWLESCPPEVQSNPSEASISLGMFKTAPFQC